MKKRLWGTEEGGDKISWHKLVFNIHFEINLLLLPLFLQLFRYSMPESPSILFPYQNVVRKKYFVLFGFLFFFPFNNTFPKEEQASEDGCKHSLHQFELCKNLTLNDLRRITICPLVMNIFFKLGYQGFLSSRQMTATLSSTWQSK